MNIQDFISERQLRVNSCLRSKLAQLPKPAPRLREAMEYSLFAKGKRVRPLLAYASAEAVGKASGGNNDDAIDSVACALECVHTYSLIHDDLPAMDDDVLRRGMPTCHIAFDEATAVLAGDALQALAFEIITAELSVSAPTIVKLISQLALASGAGGMVAGQAMDLAATDQVVSVSELEQVHRLKTGALIKASVLMGATAMESVSAEQLLALGRYADTVGLAFQVQDDLLDVTGNTEALGKTQGADQRLRKSTYVSLLGLEPARTKAEELLQQALQALEGFDIRADPLRQLAEYVVRRDR